CFFFFSSRRRHTRFSRDWSSDVCSSDLLSNMTTGSGKYTYILADGSVVETSQLYVDRMANKNLKWETTTSYNAGLDLDFLDSRRSEERRVGKECRYRCVA